MLSPSHSHIWQLCLVPYIFISLDGLSLGSPRGFECQFGILLLYMVKGARECCVWKICSEFALIRGGKSINLKLARKIKLSWINLQCSPLGDILNNVLFKAFLGFWGFFPGLAVLPLTESFDQQTHPKTPLITLLDLSPLMSQARLCSD